MRAGASLNKSWRGSKPSYQRYLPGSATLEPWPLAVPELSEPVVGYRADGYPERLEPVERLFRLRPA